MASYRIEFKKSAEKELRAVPHPFLKKIISKIQKLTGNPRPSGIEKLESEHEYYRLRQNDYRIIFEINDQAQSVTIVRIGHRRDVYRS